MAAFLFEYKAIGVIAKIVENFSMMTYCLASSADYQEENFAFYD